MRELIRSALVARSPALLYRLVEDVGDYPNFVPGVAEATVLSHTADEVVARLVVKRGPLHTHFTTRNRLTPARSVRMTLVEGPFRMLDGQWLFTPVGQNGCRIEFTLRFQFSNALKAVLFEPLFEETAASLVRAFVARAQQLPDV